MADDFEQAAEGALDEIEEPEELESEELGGAEAAPEAPEGGREEPAAPPRGGAEPAAEPAGPADWQSHLRQGETPQQAIARLAAESSQQHGRATAHYHELKAIREEVAGMRPQLAAAERLFAAMQKRAEAEERAALEKELPDPELEPERHQQMQLRAINERLAAQEARREREAQDSLTREEYQRRQATLQEVDGRAYHEITAALGMVEGVAPDPEFQAAFERVNDLQYRDLLDRYPDAPPEKVEEALGLIRTIWGRESAARGSSIRDEYLRRARHLTEVMGGAAPPAATNGHGKGKRGPSPREIEAAAAKAGRGAGMRRTSGGGSVAPPKTFEDFAALPEAEQAKIIEQGKLDESELWAGLSDPDWG